MIILRREVELCIMCDAYRVAGITTTPANGGFLSVRVVPTSNSFFSQGCEETFQAVAIP